MTDKSDMSGMSDMSDANNSNRVRGLQPKMHISRRNGLLLSDISDIGHTRTPTRQKMPLGRAADPAAILDLDPEIEVWQAGIGGTVRSIRLPGPRTWIDAVGEPVKASGMTRPKKWAEWF